MKHLLTAAGSDQFSYLVDCERLFLAVNYEVAVRAYGAEIAYWVDFVFLL